MSTARVSFVFGPTSSGKTAWAHSLAAQQGGNILSADARQIYRHMDVVTGRDLPHDAIVTQETLGDSTQTVWQTPSGIRIYGHDIVAPNQEFSIAHWYTYVQPIVEQHAATHQPLIIVGGSWPYLSVLFDPPATLFVPPNEALRSQATTWSVAELQTRLQAAQPESWERMNTADRHNPRRLIRALEVALDHHDTNPPTPLIDPAQVQLIVPTLPTPDLEARIALRVHERWTHGALSETEFLMRTYPDWSFPAFSSTGYTHLRDFLTGSLTEHEAQTRWIQQERQYAKRQQTWLQALPHKYPEIWATRETFGSIRHIDPESSHP